MKKRINVQFLIISAVGVLLTLSLSTAIFYKLLKNEVMDGLETYAHIIKNTEGYQSLLEEMYDPDRDHFRITIVKNNGEVIYDSNTRAGEIGNHADRQEIKDALQHGEGETVRTSDTMNRSTFYYAVLLDDGNVLRVAKEAGSIWSVFMRVMPAIAILAAVLFIFSKQQENILENAKMRQEFTANVSHELKTPLAAISGYSELIENRMTNEEETIRFAGEIHKSANRLLTLINDTIRLSQLDDGKLKPSYEMIDLYKIAEDCVNMLSLSAEKQGITIEIQGSSSLLEGNREMMEEIVYNLCDNAIRYNNEGGKVKVIVKPMGEKIYLSVEDNGIGISKEHQERIFERFYRVDKSRSKSKGGTGLGLAIVKHIVQQHGAQMRLSSEQGMGTKIEVEFLKKR